MAFFLPFGNQNGTTTAKEKEGQEAKEKRKMEKGKNRMIKSSKRKGGEKEERNKERGCANARKIVQLNPAIPDPRVTEIRQ